LYTNIGLRQQTNLHGAMYYTIGVTCEFNGHEQYTVVIAWQYNPPISKFISTCIEFTSLKQFG